MTRDDWKRSARQGGPGWTLAGGLLALGLVGMIATWRPALPHVHRVVEGY